MYQLTLKEIGPTADEMRKAALTALGRYDRHLIASTAYQGSIDRKCTQAQHKHMGTMKNIIHYMLANNR